MLRRSFTAVLEKNATFDENFATEPYEVAWAIEARFYVRIFEMSGENAQLSLTPQISPDGLTWCDEGSPPIVVDQPGLHSVAVHDFGHWLRLDGKLVGEDATVRAQIYLALKG